MEKRRYTFPVDRLHLRGPPSTPLTSRVPSDPDLRSIVFTTPGFARIRNNGTYTMCIEIGVRTAGQRSTHCFVGATFYARKWIVVAIDSRKRTSIDLLVNIDYRYEVSITDA